MSPDLLDEAALRDALSGPDPFDMPEDNCWAGAARTPIPAAVLVGITIGPAPGILLTKRTTHLRHHSGQVSFPGGRIDPGDVSPEAAALREAKEEVGLDSAYVEVIGRLRDFSTSSGYRITPILAFLKPGFVALPSPHEVDAVFQLALAVLLDPEAPVRRRAQIGETEREFWVWPHPDHHIWGATALILVHLAQRLRVAARERGGAQDVGMLHTFVR